MTEAEWQSCNYPSLMLEALRGKASDRKLRLFACALCRPFCFDERTSKAVVTIEDYVDGLASHNELAVCARNIDGFWRRINESRRDRASKSSRIGQTSYEIVSYAAGHDPWRAASDVIRTATWLNRNTNTGLDTSAQARLLRDMFENNYRPSRLLAEWQSRTVVDLVLAIYNQRTFEQMPILADALEESGCHDEVVLQHCRQAQEHCRGCWVADLLLGRE